MRQNETRRAGGRDSEDRLHRVLVLVLGAVAGGVLLMREPASPVVELGQPRGTIASDAPSREALEAAIVELTRWFERTENIGHTPLAANLRLLALGRAALRPSQGADAAAQAWKNLDELARPTTPGARPVSLPQPGAEIAEREAGATATLAILLETGAPLEEELALPSGRTSVRRLLELALPARAERGEEADPWALDLLSFAVLAGTPQRRDELERQTLGSLARLEREQRQLTVLMGDGAPAAGALEKLVSELRASRANGGGWSRELSLSAAVFRAVAVLAEPELEQRALRHLNALLFRQQIERDVGEQLLTRAQTARERVDVRLEAIEALGRLEQALYGAHLAFRRMDRPGPSPRTASSMRRAASELLAELDALRTSGTFAPAGDGSDGTRAERLARAAAHALRGLRAARISL